jgi:hypothetical protein
MSLPIGSTCFAHHIHASLFQNGRKTDRIGNELRICRWAALVAEPSTTMMSPA